MPTVLVPLDETAFAESILPDAEQIAGHGGRILLISVLPHGEGRTDPTADVGDVERYLTDEAEVLTARGFQTKTKVLVGGDIPRAIDEGVTALGAEMVAVATRGSAHGGWLARSSIAWKTLAHSPVPILFRREANGQVRESARPGPQPVTILVPLDGSPRGEQALPVAAALATRWHGSLVLVQVVSEPTAGYASKSEAAANMMLPVIDVDSIRSGGYSTGGELYLNQLARDHAVPVHTVLIHGSAGEALATFAHEHAVSHVVMTSHGRTGLSRVIIGDVAAQLIDRLSLPVIVVPALSQTRRQQQQSHPMEAGATSVGTSQ